MSRYLALSGGTFAGACQVFPVEQLCARYDYHGIYGVSVGALNGLAVAQRRPGDLRPSWEDIKGIRSIMRRRVDVWNGLYSLAPARAVLDRQMRRGGLHIPLYVGVVDFELERYRTLVVDDSSDGIDRIIASASQPIIMRGQVVRLPGGNTRLCYDGGLRHVIPTTPGLEAGDVLDVVLATPILRRQEQSRERLDGPLEVAARALEIYGDGVFREDMRRLRRLVERGVSVTVYAPAVAGHPFDAHPLTIEWRLDIAGRWAWEHPVVVD